MIQDDQDKKTNEELRAIREEMRTANEAERKQLFEAYVEAAHDGMQVTDPYQMGLLIIEFLKNSEERYPAVMDVHDGHHEKAAGPILGLMLVNAHDYEKGEPWAPHVMTIAEACDAFEEVCAIQVCDLQDTAQVNRGGIFRL